MGDIRETYPAQITVTKWEPVVQLTEEETPKYMARINEKLYVDTGKISNELRCGVMDFSFDSKVEGIPQKNSQTNFSAEVEGQYGMNENTIEIFFENEWHIFELSEK